jgi:hypothetical protein
MSRQTLHELVDRIPEEELVAAQRFWEYLAVISAYRQFSLLRRMTSQLARATQTQSRGRKGNSVHEKLSRMKKFCGNSA